MKMKLRKLMQQAASYIEIVLSAFLLMVIIFLAGEFIVESVMGIGYDNATLEYFLEKVMTFAIGVEFVKMLCRHSAQTVDEELMFATARQMVVEHMKPSQTLIGVIAIAILFAIRKCLMTEDDDMAHAPVKKHADKNIDENVDEKE